MKNKVQTTAPKTHYLVIVLVACALIYGVASALIRWLCGRLGDTVSDLTTFSHLLVPTGFCALVLLTTAFLLQNQSEKYCGEMYWYYTNTLQHKLFFAQQQKLDEQHEGHITTLLAKDADIIINAQQYLYRRGLPDLAVFCAALAVLTIIHPALLCVGLVGAGFTVGISKLVEQPMRRGYSAYQKAQDDVNIGLLDTLHHLDAIKASELENTFENITDKNLQYLQKAKEKCARNEFMLSAPSVFSAFATIFAMAICGGWLAACKYITLGQLLTALTLSDSVVSPVMSFERVIAQYRQKCAAEERIQNFLNLPEDEYIDCDTDLKSLNKQETIPTICLENVSFSYNMVTPVLVQKSCIFAPNKVNYIIGPNGSGKSTLLKLLCGLYSPISGDILYNGHSISRINKRELRKQFAYATQDPLLFSLSILDNLTLQKSDIPYEDVVKVCSALGIHEEIIALKNGYQTQLYENGKPLSKGQCQRLTLARAILRKSPILVFDEPTASIDAIHAEQFIKHLRVLATKRLVIVITHRMDMVKPTDNIVTLA